jgi:hypothetical protein
MVPDHAPVEPPPALLAHDTRACLAVGYGRVRLARRAVVDRPPDLPRLARCLDEIEECLTRLAGLVDALEQMGRRGETPPRVGVDA